jgi:hypothetical protein
MPTVYFDTSFYVDLARADAGQAVAVLEGLNQLEIRGVFSFDIMDELLAFAGDLKHDQKLFRRLAALSEGFLHLDNGSWDFLLLQGEDRERVAARIRADRSISDLGKSFGLSAEKPMSRRESHRMMSANRESFKKAGFLDERDEFDITGFSKIIDATTQIPSLPGPLVTKLREANVLLTEMLDTTDPAEKAKIQRRIESGLDEFMQLVKQLAPDEFQRMRAEREAFEGDSRPQQVVTQTGHKSIPGRLSNSYRDAGHIGRFVANRDVVDFLQVDRANFNRLTDPNGLNTTQLHEYGLAGRVFTTPFEDILAVLRELKE